MAGGGRLAKALVVLSLVGSVLGVAGRASAACGYTFTAADAAAGSLNSIVASKPENFVFCFSAITYRQRRGDVIIPRNGDQFIGAGIGQTILTGAQPVTGWTLVGGLWRGTPAGGTVANQVDAENHCVRPPALPTGEECRYHDDAFRTVSGNISALKRRLPNPLCSSAGVLTASTQFCVEYGSPGAIWVKDKSGTIEYSNNAQQFLTGWHKSNVTVRSLTVQMYRTFNVGGAIRVDYDGALVAGVEARFNHWTGVDIIADETERGQPPAAPAMLANNLLHHNGLTGFHSYRSTDVLVTGNELSFNNYAGYSPGWGAGAMKVTGSLDMSFTGNNVHDNDGQGIWFDVWNRGAVITGNTVGDSGLPEPFGGGNGIILELSCDMTVSDNTIVVRGAGDWGIHLRNDQDDLIQGNTITVNGSPTGGAIELMGNREPINYPYGRLCTPTPGSRLTASRNTVDANEVFYTLTSVGHTVGKAASVVKLDTQIVVGNAYTQNSYHPVAGDNLLCGGRLSFTWYDGSSNRAASWGTVDPKWKATFGQDVLGACVPVAA